MEDNSGCGIIVFLIIGMMWFGWSNHQKTKEIDELSAQLSFIRVCALDQMNSIEDAKNYAWASYEEMGNALDDLTDRDCSDY